MTAPSATAVKTLPMFSPRCPIADGREHKLDSATEKDGFRRSGTLGARPPDEPVPAHRLDHLADVGDPHGVVGRRRCARAVYGMIHPARSVGLDGTSHPARSVGLDGTSHPAR